MGSGSHLDPLIMLLNFMLHLRPLICEKQHFRRLDLADLFGETEPLLNKCGIDIKSAQPVQRRSIHSDESPHLLHRKY